MYSVKSAAWIALLFFWGMLHNGGWSFHHVRQHF